MLGGVINKISGFCSIKKYYGITKSLNHCASLVFFGFMLFSFSSWADDVKFHSGFNLFSYPGEPPVALFCTDLKTQLDAESLKRFDAQSQQFSVCGTDEVFSIVAGEGYVASKLTDGVFTLDATTTCPLLDLSPGINLVAVPTPEIGMGCYDLIRKLGSQENVTSVQRFNTGMGTFESCFYNRLDSTIQPLGDNFSIQSGDAFWVSMHTALVGVQLNDSAQCGTVFDPPLISDFAPKAGQVGTLITITGSNFAPSVGLNPEVTMARRGGGRIRAPIARFSDNQIQVTVPTGAVTGLLDILVGIQKATTIEPFTVRSSSDFTLSATPATVELIQGQSISYSITIDSTNGFSAFAELRVDGLPAGISAKFDPVKIGAGQRSILTLSTQDSQPIGKSTFQVIADTEVDGIVLTQSSDLSVTVIAKTTSFLGRVVISDAEQTPLAGATVTLLGLDGSGNPTSCTGETVSDAVGNFAFTNLPITCVGDQLVRYDGLTVTNQNGKYAGVDLVYNITAGQVTESPVLIHLPRIDNGETVMVIQNHTLDQTFRFATIPNLSVTIYAGTTLTLKDGTQPDPFPLIAVDVPIDRLPDEMPLSDTVDPFIVAFQPANAQASEPVAVTFPNRLNTAPGTHLTLMTLDPTKGEMVQYGTGTVSDDGLTIVPDLDPASPGKRFGLVHFDWHGPAGPGPNQNDPCPNGPCGGDPVHFASGLVIDQHTDIAIPAPGGGVSIQRTYRTQTTNVGPFGIGGNHNYSYFLNLSNPSQTTPVINFVVPAGNQFPMTNNGGGVFTNATEPFLRGVVLEIKEGGTVDVTFKDGSVFHFIPGSFRLGSVLQSITDLNGNTTTLVRNPSNALQITEVIDSVGRKLRLNYDSASRITQLTDPIGRTVQYTYTSFGRLATVTDPEGGVTRYSYIKPTPSTETNLIASITDARGVIVAQNFYGQFYGPSCGGATGLNPDDLAAISQVLRDACVNDPQTVTDQRIWKQVAADGGEMLFHYTLSNQSVPLSPVINTKVTDARGNSTNYRFSTQGQLLNATDPLGQKMIFDREPGGNQLLGKRGGAICVLCGDIRSGDVTMTRDESGNVRAVTGALGNVNSIAYDPRFNKPTLVIDALGNTSSFSYDAKGNLLSTTDANTNSTVYTYNSRGLPTIVSNALGDNTILDYDAFGNLVKTTDALGNTTVFSYDAIGRLNETVDAQGRRTQLTYDNLGRVVTQTDANGGVTTLIYDEVSNLLSVTDARNNTVLFAYDEMNRVVTRTDAAGITETFGYDLNGNLIVATDRRGQISRFSYDAINQNISAIYADGSSVTNEYDARGRLIRLVDSIGGIQTFQYDALGRATRQTNVNGTLDYQYDAVGRTLSRQVVGQPVVNYTYDAVGNLLSVADSQASVDFSYDALNRRNRLQRDNGVNTNQSYDALGRVLSIIHSNASGIIDQQIYSYDKLGNRKSLDNTLGQPYITPSADATFDAANRLIQSGNNSYTYDKNGNRLSKTGPGGTTSYNWDSRNRLMSITEPDGSVTQFTYDAFNNLISQQVNGSAGNLDTDYLVDDLSNVIRQTNSEGQSLEIMTGRIVDDHLVINRNDGTQDYISRDSNNSTIASTDSAGALKQSFSYEPYGQSSVVVTKFPIQFTGRLPVADGLYYYRARFFDPEVGRFLKEDPIGLSGGINQYAYTFGNPIKFTDPSGEFVPLIVLIPVIGGLISGGFEAFNESIKCNASASSILKGFGRGFASGAVGTLAGIGAGVATGNPFVGGEVGGAVGSGVGQAFSGKFSPGDIAINATVGAVVGPLAGKLLPTRGFLPKLLKPRTISNFGKNSARLLGQEAISGGIGGTVGTAKSVAFPGSQPCGCN